MEMQRCRLVSKAVLCVYNDRIPHIGFDDWNRPLAIDTDDWSRVPIRGSRNPADIEIVGDRFCQ